MSPDHWLEQLQKHRDSQPPYVPPEMPMTPEQVELSREFQSRADFKLVEGMCFVVSGGKSRVLWVNDEWACLSIPSFRETTTGRTSEIVKDIGGVLDLTDPANDGILLRLLGDGRSCRALGDGSVTASKGDGLPFSGATVADACVRALLCRWEMPLITPSACIGVVGDRNES